MVRKADCFGYGGRCQIICAQQDTFAPPGEREGIRCHQDAVIARFGRNLRTCANRLGRWKPKAQARGLIGKADVELW